MTLLVTHFHVRITVGESLIMGRIRRRIVVIVRDIRLRPTTHMNTARDASCLIMSSVIVASQVHACIYIVVRRVDNHRTQ